MSLPVAAPIPSHRRLKAPLAVKFAAAVIGLVVLVLLVNGALSLWLSYQEAKRAILQVQLERAQATSEKIYRFVSELESQIGWTTQAGWQGSGIKQQRADFARLLRQAPTITSLIYLDGDGRERLKASPLGPDTIASLTDRSAELGFAGAMENGTWFSTIMFRSGSEPYMTIAMAHDGPNRGVTVAEVALKPIWDVVRAIRVGETGYVYAVGPRGKLIAHPDMKLVLHDTDMTVLPQVREALAATGDRASSSAAAAATNLEGQPVLSVYARIPRLGWVVFVESSAGEALASVYAHLWHSLLLLALGLLLAIIVGTWLARRMVVPIAQLQAGAEKLGEGDLSQRIAIHTGDEIETLADRFNVMAGRIQESHETLEAKVQERTRDLDETLQQQTATADVLKVISRSAFDLDTIFATLIGTAIELCGATRGVIWLRKGEQLFLAAQVGYPDEWVAAVRDYALTPAADSPTTSGLAAFTGEIVHVEDVPNDPRFGSLAVHKLGDYRAGIAVPLKRDGKVEGVISLSRPEARLFTDRQVALVQTFADQAVIAIENARLFNELEVRNRDVTEALDQQTATAEVLKTISSSAFNLDSVLHTLVKSASDLCHSAMGYIYLRKGEVFQPTLQIGWSPEFHAYMSKIPVKPGRGSVAARVALTAAVVQVPDVLADPEYTNLEGQKIGGFRSVLGVPLLRDGVVMGVFILARSSVAPFSTREVELVQTFSDQAVIAIENVRLFEEVQARTADLSESLQQQTATADVLKAISRSIFDLQPVLDMLVESAAKLCDADSGAIFKRDGDLYRWSANYGHSPEMDAYARANPHMPGRYSATSRVALEARTIHISDVLADPEYTADQHQALGQYRTVLGVPILREGVPVGVFTLARSNVRDFTPRQIELVESFADQAGIAIENMRLFEEVQARNRDVTEALERQTATGAILRVIAESPTDIQPVLDSVAESAARLCDAYDATIYLLRADWLAVGAHHGPIPVDDSGLPVSRDVVTGRSILDRTSVHVHDLTVAGEEFATGRMMAHRLGFRTILATPLLQEGEAIGALMIRRTEARPFGDNQIELLKTFADQAVIAIQNVRLFDELQARTAELSESLQQQTATADVLKAISRSTFDLDTVLRTLIASAARLCDTGPGEVWRRDGDIYRLVVAQDLNSEFVRLERQLEVRPGRGSTVARAVQEARAVQIADVLADPDYELKDVARIGGIRTVLAVPLLREGESIGAFSFARNQVNPFTDRQIELVETFADQAVIAIENVRLFDEVQARTADLSEALQQQTATADVLKVISRSAFDLRSVLQTLIDSAVRLCGAKTSGIFMRDGDVFRLAAGYDQTPEYRAYEEANPSPISRQSWVGRTALDKAVVHIPDITKDPEHGFPEAPRLGGYSAVLCVPLMREGSVIGVFGLTRPEPGPFTDSQIELVQTFADQAVIAIENVRLFDEVQARTADLSEALQQQTATADVLKAISRSTFDLQPVLDALVESAAKLCDADKGVIFKRDGDAYRWSANYGSPPELEAFARAHPFKPGRYSVTSRVALEAKAIHVSDVLADPEYEASQYQKLGGFRTILCVPILREGAPVGVFALTRSEVKDFTPRQIELVETFADQAGIAIENVRLFEELQTRTAELGEALQQQTATADVLKVISRSAFHLPTVFDTLVRSAVKLCGASYGGIFMRHGEILQAGATLGAGGARVGAVMDQVIARDRKTISGRVLLSGHVEHIPDVLVDPEYDPKALVQFPGTRALMGVPLLREGKVDGVFVLDKPEPGDFTPRQAELVQTFADQAVIAIENVRLFDQVQARTGELSRSIEELRTAQGRLVQTEKLASLGQLTAGIAHEIKNPLNFVNNFSSLSGELVDELRELLEGAVLDGNTRADIEELADMLKGNLDKVVQHGKRADSIVKNMLLHSREGAGDHRLVDINAVVEESLNLAYHGARAERKGFNITLDKAFDPEAGNVDLYPQEITRVLLNLISNGFYATIKRGTEVNGAAYEPVLTASTKSLGDSVEIRIRDNGTGIPPEVQEKMFNPFFTTKPAGEGTGLGLSLSYDIIVKQHAGTIEVDTEPGSFTEFRIVLPRQAALLAKSGDTA